MAFDESLAARIRDALSGKKGVEERKMFGGICFLLHGNLLVGVFRALPPELEESALVDGTTRWGAFTRVALPLAAPGIATAGIVTFLFAWNEFLFALSFTLGADRQTVPVAIAMFRGQYQVPWGEVLAASMIATLPVLLVVLLFQRRIVQGLTSGAVTG